VAHVSSPAQFAGVLLELQVLSALEGRPLRCFWPARWIVVPAARDLRIFQAGLESTSMKPSRQRWAIMFFSKFPAMLFLVIVRRMYAGDLSKPWHPHAPVLGFCLAVVHSAEKPDSWRRYYGTARRNHGPCKSVRKNRLRRHALIRCAGLLVCSANYLHIASISGHGSADHVRLSGLEPRFTCSASGNLDADIRPGFNCDKPDALTRGD
jgi:hypothetical protein